MAFASDNPEALRVDPTEALRAMIRCVAIAMLSAAAPMALVLGLVARADWWLGFSAASVLSVLAAGASIAVLRIGMGFGIGGAIAGHFGGVAVRLLIVLGGGMLMVAAGGYPAAPTLGLAVPYYFATLAGEIVALAKVFRPTYVAEVGGHSTASAPAPTP